MKPLALAVDALAAYRLARLFAAEDAPVALWARGLVLDHTPERWHAVTDCQHCAGLWAAVGVGVLRAVPGLRLLAYPLAVGGLQSLIVTLAAPDDEDGPEEPQGPVQADTVEAMQHGLAPRYVPLAQRP